MEWPFSPPATSQGRRALLVRSGNMAQGGMICQFSLEASWQPPSPWSMQARGEAWTSVSAALSDHADSRSTKGKKLAIKALRHVLSAI